MIKNHKILIDARSITSKPCGVRRVAEQYCHYLSKKFEIVILVSNDSPFKLRNNKGEIIKFNRYMSRFMPIGDLYISYLVLRRKPDTFISMHSFLPIFSILPKSRLFILHDLFSVLDETFFSARGAMSVWIQKYFKLLTVMSLRRATMVITPSKFTLNMIRQIYIKSINFSVIPNGIEPVISIDDLVPYNERENCIVYIGNFREYKGFKTLYEAWKICCELEEFKSWRLVVYTNESNESISKFIDDNGDLSKISFFSRASDLTVQGKLANSKLVVVPSNYEGFGIPLIEAEAYGCKVICSDIPAFREIAHDNVIFFNAKDSNLLSSVMTKEISNFNKNSNCFNLIEMASLIREQFMWEKSSEKLINEIMNDV